MRKVYPCIFSYLAVVSLVSATGATVLRVPSEYPTIRSGLYAASYGDTVLVAQGTYHEYWLLMTNGVTLTSSDGHESTIIDADSLGPVIVCGAVDDQTVISGFTIQEGFYHSGAGIICSSQSSPRLENNRIRYNVAYQWGGAGIRADYGSCPTIVGNRIESNLAQEGGGILCRDTQGVRIEDNLIADNLAMAYGGGITAKFCSVDILGNTIVNNKASMYACGGIDLWFADALICDNVICGNEAPSGGGIHAWRTLATQIARNTICHNRANTGAGITCFDGANPLIANNTLYANTSAPGGGAGIYCVDHSSPTITNNIIAGAIHGGGISVAETTCQPSISYNDVWNNSGGDYLGCEPGPGDISDDPEFVFRARDDLRLLWGSPCIDAGNPDSLDPDGTWRDMGAFFFDQSASITVYLTPDAAVLSPLDTLRVLYTLINITPQQISFWGLTGVTLPNGSPYPRNPIVGPLEVTLPPEQSARRILVHPISEMAPLGDYEYWAYVGFPPDTLIDSDRIEFSLIAGQ